MLGSTRRNTEKARFGVNGIQATVLTELHPCDVISNGFYFPSGDGWDEHCKVGFPARRGEGSGNVL